MKKLMIGAAAAALIAPMTANAQMDTQPRTEPTQTEEETKAPTQRPASEQPAPGAAAPTQTPGQVSAETPASRGADAQSETRSAAQDAESGFVYLAPTQIAAKDLLGEGIHGANDERIARVDDLVIGSEGAIEKVVFMSGGIFGFGGERGALDYSEVDIAVQDDHDPRVRVSMTEEAIKAVGAYEIDAVNDYRLASELIGASGELSGGEESAVVTDLLIEEDGTVRSAIVQNGLIRSLGGEKRVVDLSAITIAQGDGGVVIGLTPEELEARPRFEYSDMSVYDTTERPVTSTPQ